MKLLLSFKACQASKLFYVDSSKFGSMQSRDLPLAYFEFGVYILYLHETSIGNVPPVHLYMLWIHYDNASLFL